MKLMLTVNVPSSAVGASLEALLAAAHDQQGVTITMPTGVKVDVDLIDVGWAAKVEAKL